MPLGVREDQDHRTPALRVGIGGGLDGPDRGLPGVVQGRQLPVHRRTDFAVVDEESIGDEGTSVLHLKVVDYSMRPSERSCVRCGNPITNNPKPTAKFCGSACYHASAVVGGYERTCDHCGAKFRRAVKGARFCGRSCYLAAKPLVTATKRCPRCDKSFTVPATIADRFTVCSRACRLSVTKYRDCERCDKRFRVQRHYNRFCSEECRRPPRIVVCETCTVDFRVVPSSTARFCSIACWRRGKGETRLEAGAREALTGMGLAFTQEMRMGRYSVDFALTDYGVALEMDGTYWHRDKARDARKDGFLRKHGWRVVRVAEADVERAGAEQAIRAALQDVIAFP